MHITYAFGQGLSGLLCIVVHCFSHAVLLQLVAHANVLNTGGCHFLKFSCIAEPAGENSRWEETNPPTNCGCALAQRKVARTLLPSSRPVEREEEREGGVQPLLWKSEKGSPHSNVYRFTSSHMRP